LDSRKILVTTALLSLLPAASSLTRPAAFSAALPQFNPAAGVGRQAARDGEGWRPAPEFLPLFTPRHVPDGAYEAYVTSRDLDATLREVRGNPAFSTPGAWNVQAVIPSDAFGESGGYNRWTVARLYGATRALVARAPRLEHGTVVETWTLVSPYPNASLDRLESGTLLLVLRVP
jgi:hypothetical protein